MNRNQKIDYRPLRTDDPVADAEYFASQEPTPIGVCEECGMNIYPGMDYINLYGELLHDEYECIMPYIRRNFKEE